jgi:hypothetical protein
MGRDINATIHEPFVGVYLPPPRRRFKWRSILAYDLPAATVLRAALSGGERAGILGASYKLGREEKIARAMIGVDDRRACHARFRRPRLA